MLPAALYKDKAVTMTTKPYKPTEVKESVKRTGSSVAMDTTPDSGNNDDVVTYDDG